MKHSSEFNSRPFLISSCPSGYEALRASVKSASGDWDDADVFFLMTDALACWFLCSLESCQNPWEVLYDLEKDETFEAWISELRNTGSLRNDDVTLEAVK